jgi:hypothetical protein
MSKLHSELVFIPQQVLHILWPKNLTNHLYTQSVQDLISTGTRLQKSVVTKPCVETGRLSNWQKAEFVNNFFCIQSFWGGYGEILPKT